MGARHARHQAAGPHGPARALRQAATVTAGFLVVSALAQAAGWRQGRSLTSLVVTALVGFAVVLTVLVGRELLRQRRQRGVHAAPAGRREQPDTWVLHGIGPDDLAG